MYLLTFNLKSLSLFMTLLLTQCHQYAAHPNKRHSNRGMGGRRGGSAPKKIFRPLW